MGIATVRTLTVNQLCERKNDLIIPVETINELAKRERAKAIDEFMEVVKATYHNFCGFDLERMTKYGNEDASQQEQSYSTMMMYEIAMEFDDLIDDLEQLKAGDK